MSEIFKDLYYDGELGRLVNKLTLKVYNYPRASGKAYVKLYYKGRYYQYHNVVYCCTHGEIPSGFTVDHIDGDKLNNRIENLRLATPMQQTYNTRSYGKTSKYKGVDFNKKSGKYFSRIMVDGESIWLGSYRNELDAAKAYEKAAIRYHGDFKNIRGGHVV